MPQVRLKEYVELERVLQLQFFYKCVDHILLMITRTGRYYNGLQYSEDRIEYCVEINKQKERK